MNGSYLPPPPDFASHSPFWRCELVYPAPTTLAPPLSRTDSGKAFVQIAKASDKPLTRAKPSSGGLSSFGLAYLQLAEVHWALPRDLPPPASIMVCLWKPRYRQPNLPPISATHLM
jgi:hypothetical protein